MASVRCEICNRELTNSMSIARGIGPICWGKIMVIQLLKLTSVLDQGAQTNKDEFPPLEYYLKQITIWECQHCGDDLHNAKVNHYVHRSGVPLHGWHEKQWISLVCPKCRINISLIKLGVNWEIDLESQN